MILRLQSEQELELLQSRIKAKSKEVKVHVNGLREERGTDFNAALQAGQSTSTAPSQEGHAAGLAVAAPDPVQDAPRKLQDHAGGSNASIPERDVQKSIIGFLRGHPRVAWVERMNSGAGKKKGFYMRFGFVGCPDILGQMKDGRVLAVECKTRGGKVTPSQHGFISKVLQWKGVAGICYSLDDVKDLLATY